jgi:energy-coupling factor transporter ATP-binding protein EcfA2
MEIIHLWVRNLRGVENVNYGFTSRFGVKVNLDAPNVNIEVSVKEGQETIDDFYGENFINVNCIVGSNGAGKTTLLQLLADILSRQFKYGIHESVLVFYDKKTNSFSCTHNLNSSRTASLLDSLDKKHQVEEKYEVNPSPPDGYEWQEHKLGGRSAAIYYTPIVNFSEWHANNSRTSLIDVSTDSLMRRDFDLIDSEIDLIENHRLFNFQRQIDLRQKFSGKELVEEFTLPDTVILSSLEPSPDQNWGHNLSHTYSTIRVYFLSGEKAGVRGSFDEKIYDIGGQMHEMKEGSKMDDFHELAYERTVWSFLRNLVDHYFSMMNRANHWLELDAKFGPEDIPKEGFFEPIRHFFELENWLVDGGKAGLSLLACLEDFFECKSGEAIGDSSDYSKFKTQDFDRIQAILKAQEAYLLSIPGQKPPERLPALYHVGWRDISSGEKAYLDLFSRLNYAYGLLPRHEGDEPEFVYLFLDEGELGFHPEWQKKYVRLLLESLSAIFKGIQIQVFIASHSPFVLSDFHPNSILYLDDLVRADSMSFFGANIHTVFAEGFGVDDGLVGEFAKGKIQEVINLLNSEAPVEELESKTASVISIIGEPIVRKKLTKTLDEKLGRNPQLMMIEAEIKRLQELRDKIQPADDKDRK